MKDQLVIMAGGQGKRMNSDMPKPLIPIAGQSIIKRLLERMSPLFPVPVIVVGHKKEMIIEALGDSYSYAEQKEQLGTGDALLAAKPKLEGVETIVVMPGDHPLVSLETIRDLIDIHKKNNDVISLATVKLPDFSGDFKVCERGGRIIRNADGSISRIIEYKDASEAERNITEVNPSYYCFNANWLWENIGKIQPNNTAKEYYLTDLLGIATSQGHKVHSIEVKNPFEGMGVNNPEELSIVEKYIQKL